MRERLLDRLKRAAAEADHAGLAGLIVAPSADLLYLTGYDPPAFERLTCLLIPGEGDPTLLVPELERPRALACPVGASLQLEGWRDGDDPYTAASSLLPGTGVYGVSDRMWALHLLGLQRNLGETSFVPASPVLSSLRAVKDEDEVEVLARAARGADESFRRLTQSRLERLKEKEASQLLGQLLREHGHEEVNFAIVASGPNGASPHHDPGERRIREGDPVVLDFGGRLAGYCSDLSRTVCVGRVPPELEEVYGVVREAQERAFRAVAPGVPAQEVDHAARSVIEAAGFGERFIHRTGHGIGLEEHEAPYIVRGNAEPLRPGMCFSIEPGIYLEGRLGVRIEDIVVVTEDGGRRLNRAPRELLVVG